MNLFSLWLQLVRLAPVAYVLHAFAWSGVFGLPILIGYVASQVVASEDSREQLVAVFLALCAARAVTVVFSDRLEIALTYRVLAAHRKALTLSACETFERACTSSRSIGHLLTSFQRDTGAIATFACASSVTLSRAIFLMIAFLWLFQISFTLAFAAMLVTAGGAFFISRVTAMSVRTSNALERETGRDTNLLHSIVAAPASIITSGCGEAFVQVLARSFEGRKRAGITLGVASFSQQHIPTLLLSLPIAAILFSGLDPSRAAEVLLAVTLLGFVAENFSKLNRIALLHAQASAALARLQVIAQRSDQSNGSGVGGERIDATGAITILRALDPARDEASIARLHSSFPGAGMLLSRGRFAFEGSALENLLMDVHAMDPALFMKWYGGLGFTNDFAGTDTFDSAVAHLGRTPYGSLSGGQAERLHCMRLLLHGRTTLAGCEPFAGVDPATLASVVSALRNGGVRQIYITEGTRFQADVA